MTNLKLLKGKLKKWNMEVFGDMRLKKQSLLRRIKELDALEASAMWAILLLSKARNKQLLLEVLLRQNFELLLNVFVRCCG